MNVTIDMSADDLDRLAAAVADKLRPDLAKLAASAGGNGKLDKQLFNEVDTADAVSMSSHTLKRWRQAGLIPCHTSKPVRYSRADIDTILEWLRMRD